MNGLGLSRAAVIRDATARHFDLRTLRDYQALGGWIPDDVNFYQRGDGSFYTDLSLQRLMAGRDWGAFTALYLDPQGNDGNSGTTPGLPRQNVGTALAVTTPRLLILPNGAFFHYGISWRSTSARNPLVVMTVDPDGPPATLSCAFASTPMPWIWDSFEGLWRCATTVTQNLACVWDRSVVTPDGLGRRFDPWLSLTDLKAAPEGCFKDASNVVWLKHPLGSQYDPSRAMPYVRGSQGNHTNGQSTWLRCINIVFDGGGTAFSSDNNTGPAVDEGFWACTFQGTAGQRLGDGTLAAFNNTYMQGLGVSRLVRCRALGGMSDGYNYQGLRRYLEAECTAEWNGYRPGDPDATGANQGSTSHGSNGIRVGGAYLNNGAPGIQDVKSSSIQARSAILGNFLGGGLRNSPAGVVGPVDVAGTCVVAGNAFADATAMWLYGNTYAPTQGQTACIGIMGNSGEAPTVYHEDPAPPVLRTGNWGLVSTASGGINPRAPIAPLVFTGAGSPENVVTAPVGSLYTRTDGGTATTLYVKEAGSAATGWVAK